MQENVSVLVATILAVIIIVVFPIYNVATRNDSVASNMVIKATTSFVDEVRNKGYITEQDYENYLDELNKTGNTYEVELEAYAPILIETETAEEYEQKYKIDYTNDILKVFKEGNEENGQEVASTNSILNEKAYYLDTDYKFYARVKNTNITQAQVLLDRVLGGEIKDRIVVNYGGIVYSNEWSKGEGARTVGANISISRPMDVDGNEYKYEYITTVYDRYEVSDDEDIQFTDLYGIAVKLADREENSGIIKFNLTYTDINEFKDNNGNTLTTKAQRAAHIEEYIEVVGVKANEIDVEEVTDSWKKGSNGLYSGQYVITIKDIVYDYENNPYIKAKLRIKAGSGTSSSGELGQLNTEEFIIFYNLNKPTITLSAKDVDTGKAVTNGVTIEPEKGVATIEFTANAVIDSSVAKVSKIIFIIEYGNRTEKVEVNTNSSNVTESITKDFAVGKEYTVRTYAIDSRGKESEIKSIKFKVDYIKPEIGISISYSKEYYYGRDFEVDKTGRYVTTINTSNDFIEYTTWKLSKISNMSGLDADITIRARTKSTGVTIQKIRYEYLYTDGDREHRWTEHVNEGAGWWRREDSWRSGYGRWKGTSETTIKLSLNIPVYWDDPKNYGKYYLNVIVQDSRGIETTAQFDFGIRYVRLKGAATDGYKTPLTEDNDLSYSVFPGYYYSGYGTPETYAVYYLPNLPGQLIKKDVKVDFNKEMFESDIKLLSEKNMVGFVNQNTLDLYNNKQYYKVTPINNSKTIEAYEFLNLRRWNPNVFRYYHRLEWDLIFQLW